MVFDEVCLIVHPLYAQSKILENSSVLNLVTKNELDNYGRLILDAKSKNSLFVFVPSLAKNAITRRQQARLIKFAQTTLGEKRVILFPTNFGFAVYHDRLVYYGANKAEVDKLKKSMNAARRKLSKIEFSPQVKIVPTGQHFDMCVGTGSKNLINLLEELKVSISGVHFCLGSKAKFEAEKLLGKEGSVKKFRTWKNRVFGKRTRIK